MTVSNDSPTSGRQVEVVDIGPISIDAYKAIIALTDATGFTVGEVVAAIVNDHAASPFRYVAAVVEWIDGKGWCTGENVHPSLEAALRWAEAWAPPGCRIEGGDAGRFEMARTLYYVPSPDGAATG